MTWVSGYVSMVRACHTVSPVTLRDRFGDMVRVRVSVRPKKMN